MTFKTQTSPKKEYDHIPYRKLQKMIKNHPRYSKQDIALNRTKTELIKWLQDHESDIKDTDPSSSSKNGNNSTQVDMDRRIFSSKTELMVTSSSSNNGQNKFPQRLMIFDESLSYVRNIGSGAYGDVALYSNETTSISYVVKRTEVDEQAIVQKFGTGFCNAVPLRRISFHEKKTDMKYFIMPVMDGTLNDFRHGHRLSMDLVEHRKFVTQICNTVKAQLLCMYKHTNVPYMDIKGANVLYRRIKSILQVHVADIGSLNLDNNNHVTATYPPPESGKSGYVKIEKGDNHIPLLSWSIGMLFLSFVGFIDCPFDGKTRSALYMDLPQKGNNFDRQRFAYYYHSTEYVTYMQKKVELYFGKEIGDLLHPDPSQRTVLSVDKPLTCWQGDMTELSERKLQFQEYEKKHLTSLLLPYKDWTVHYSRSNPDQYYFADKTRTHGIVYTVKDIFNNYKN